MAEYASLCPGYKQVDAFGPDDDYEEEEITYVTLDLGNVEPTLLPSSSNCRLIGLDTATPFLQLSGTIFKGRHDSLLGTELLFTDGKDPTDWSKRTINHVANTEQRIIFKEVQLRPKKTFEAPPPRTDEDGRLRVDQVTGKSGPVLRRTRAPRKKPKAADDTLEENLESVSQGPDDGAEVEGSGAADDALGENPELDAQVEEEIAQSAP